MIHEHTCGGGLESGAVPPPCLLFRIGRRHTRALAQGRRRSYALEDSTEFRNIPLDAARRSWMIDATRRREGRERRVEPAKERQRSERGREIVDGASAWLRKETKKTRRGKFLAPRGATSAATTNDAAAATSVRAVVWAWCQCHPPFSFLAWTGPGGSPDLGRRRRGPSLVLAFPILGTAYQGGGAQRITAAGVGQPPSWGLHVAADCYADFWSIFFLYLGRVRGQDGFEILNFNHTDHCRHLSLCKKSPLGC